MRILALEPYYGGSHQAFLDGWSWHSRHDWTLLTLPAHNWKWRMRHAAITFAENVTERVHTGEAWDTVFCSDMLDLAGFKGLAPPSVAQLPAVAYFHENQLTYPARRHQERDYHFGLTNMTTGIAADAIWFNSAFHRDAFLEALRDLLARMTDHRSLHAWKKVKAKASVYPQGIDAFPVRSARKARPLHILWAARWEHDKNPETFFEALYLLVDQGVDFRLHVVGEQFKEAPAVFEQARARFADRIDHWGFQPAREAYAKVLAASDVVVSTAHHEFFGVSVVEAVAAGAVPLVPNRLAYPEIFDARLNPSFFYDGTASALANRLAALAANGVKEEDLRVAQSKIESFVWTALAPRLDDGLPSCRQPAAER